MIKYALILGLLVGCHHKKADTAEGGGATIDTHADSGDSTDHSGSMVPPEKMDEVQNDLKRKGMIISRCLSQAVDDGKVKKGTHGKVTLEMVISTGGKAENVKVAKTDIDNEEVLGCVKKHVEEIEFPQLPKQYETSYTYAMEAN